MRRFCAMLLAAILCCAAFRIFRSMETMNGTPPESEVIHYQDGSGDYLFIKNPSRCGPDGEAWDLFKNGVYYKTAYGVRWEDKP